MTIDVAETQPEDDFDGIPDELRFDLDDRTQPDQRQDRVKFALGSDILWASRPKEFSMLNLAAAMSGMADGPDRAYAIMVFCHDAFDGPTRDVISRNPTEKVLEIIERLCNHWGQDTSTWNKTTGNRETRRAATKSRRR